MTYVFGTDNLKRYRFPTHTNHLVMDRSEAAASEVFIVELAPGEATPAHQHDDMEQIFYVCGAVNMSGWDTLKHENARWLDRLLACRVLSHPAIQPSSQLFSEQ